jgi:protoporphyrinogen oxidase
MEQNSKKHKETIIVIGGGIGGLFSAWNLLKEGYDVTVLERQNHLGGLSTSIPYNGYQMDIGPHFITTPKNAILTKELEELMKNEIVVVDDIHKWYRVFFKNSVLYEYPPLYDIIFKNGIVSFLKSFFSYFFAKIKFSLIKNENDTAKGYIVSNYGNYLYINWFKPYLDFYYGKNKHSIKIVKGKFPQLKFKDIFNKIKKSNKKRVKTIQQNNSLSVNQWYFKNGMGSLVKKLSENIEDLGGKIILSADVKHIEHENSKKEILIEHNCNEQKLTSDIVLYTTPFSITKNWFSNYLDYVESPKQTSNGILIYLFINHPKIVDWWLIQNYEKNFCFFRITHQNYLSDCISPTGKSLLCVEINTNDNLELWDLDDEKIFEKINSDLKKMKLFNIKLIENFKIFKFKNLYSSSNPKADAISKKITEITNSLKNEFIVRVEIDTGNLVTKRVEESGKIESKSVSYGGTYQTLNQSKNIVRKINEEKNIS